MCEDAEFTFNWNSLRTTCMTWPLFGRNSYHESEFHDITYLLCAGTDSTTVILLLFIYNLIQGFKGPEGLQREQQDMCNSYMSSATLQSHSCLKIWFTQQKHTNCKLGTLDILPPRAMVQHRALSSACHRSVPKAAASSKSLALVLIYEQSQTEE